MSIVKMKRLRVIGLSEEKENLLSRLLHVGCVEVTEPEDKLSDPQWSALVRRDTTDFSDEKAQSAALTSALDALKKYTKEKSAPFTKRAEISAAEFFNDEALARALECASAINDSTREIAKLYSSENKLSSAAASLTPWMSLELPLELEETKTTRIFLGTCPVETDFSTLQSDLASATPLAQLEQVSENKELRYLTLLVHKQAEETALEALRAHSFSVMHFKDMKGTAKENLERIQNEIAQIQTARSTQENQIVARRNQRDEMRVALDRVTQDISKAQVAERFLTDGTVFFAEGWVPVDGEDAVLEVLNSCTCAYETLEPDKEDRVPTKLKNPKWMECINMVTEMYSLPAYNGIDPNPLMFFWYVFFFGFMFADVAYGIIIFLVSLIIIKKFNPKKTMGRMFHLGLWLGGSTAFCGIFVGGFFGNVLEVFYTNFLPNAVMPAWMAKFSAGLLVNPVSDPMTVLIIAVAIGCVHLIFGQCIHIYMGFRDGTPVDALLDVVPWWLLFAGIACIALVGTPVVLIVGVLGLICTQGRHKKGIFGKLFGGISSLYDITSWLSDVLSYARLMALMLATSVIAQVFNTLGALPKNILAFVVIFLIGHVFNIGVNLIGTYVHAARLQYLEFFGKFYKDGGIPFRPLQYNTKYVDINEEEQ